MRLTLVLATVGGFLLTGCDELAGCGNDDPTLTLGQGADVDWTPISNGDDMTVVQGIQGGFHVDAAGQIGPFVQEVRLSGTLTMTNPADNESVVVAEAPAFNYFLVAYDDATCTGEFFGAQVRMLQQFNDRDLIQNQMVGRDGTLDFTITDLDERNPVTASRTITLARP